MVVPRVIVTGRSNVFVVGQTVFVQIAMEEIVGSSDEAMMVAVREPGHIVLEPEDM